MAAMDGSAWSPNPCRTTNGSDLGWVALLRTVAGPRALEETATALDGQWSIHDEVPDAIRLDVGIALAEIVANIVEHGSAGGHRVQIEIQVSVEPGQVLIALVDDGNECQVPLDTAQLPDSDAERGRGLAMARSCLRELGYQRTAATNRWLLTSKPF